MAYIYDKQTYGVNTAGIEYSATATYTRSGSKVTITVKCTVDGWGHYYQAFLNGSMVIDSEKTTVYKTFTYDNAAAKTYSFPMKTYIQAIKEIDGQEKTATLTVDVPAYVPPGAQAWVNPDGTWRKAKTWLNVADVWKTLLAKINIQEGEWEP